jgi:cell division septation protein DedD
MTKNVLRGLAIGAGLIILLVVLYLVYTRSVPPTGPSPVTTPAPPPAGAPPPAAPALKGSGPPGPVTTPPGEAAGPIKEAAPGPAVKPPEVPGTVSPPEKPKEQYGLLAGRYRQYRDASKMLARMKEKGISGFIRREKGKTRPYEVWAGPYASREEALAAEKSLRALLKRTPKIMPLPAVIPK